MPIIDPWESKPSTPIVDPWEQSAAQTTLPPADGPTLSQGQGIETGIWDKITSLFGFGEDPQKESAKALQALVDSEVLKIRPSEAYENRDYIEYAGKADFNLATMRSTAMQRVEQAWQIGLAQNRIAELGYKYVETGDPQWLKEISKVPMPAKEEQFGNKSWVDKAVQSAAKMFPMMADSALEGSTKGLAVGTATGLLVAGVSAAGPQIVAAPVTVPAAATAGFTAGTISGAYASTTRKEAGLAVQELLELKDPNTGERLDPDLARASAYGIGAINGAIEVSQIGTLLKTVPGLNKIFSKAILEAVRDKTVKEALMRVAVNYAGTVAKETGQEVAQESVNIVMERVAASVNDQLKGTDIKKADATEIMKRLFETAHEAAAGFTVMAAPGHAMQVMKTIRGEKESAPKKAGATDEPTKQEPVQAPKREYKGPIVLGMEEDAQGNPTTFLMADQRTGETFSVRAVPGEFDKEGQVTSYTVDQDDLRYAMQGQNMKYDLGTSLDEIIQGGEDVDTITRRMFGEQEIPGIKVFHGGQGEFDVSRGGNRGISVTTDKSLAENFMDPDNGVVHEAVLPSSAKVLKESNIPESLLKAYKDKAVKLASFPLSGSDRAFAALQKEVLDKQQAIVDHARSNGFDAVEFPYENEIRVIKPNILKGVNNGKNQGTTGYTGTEGPQGTTGNRGEGKGTVDQGSAGQGGREGSQGSKGKRSLFAEVTKRGGLNSDKVKTNREWSEDIAEYGLQGLTSKQGKYALDDLAEEMQGEGIIGRTPDEYASAGDYLLQLLKDEKEGRATEERHTKAEQEYINDFKDAIEAAQKAYKEGFKEGAAQWKEKAIEAMNKLKWMKERRQRIADIRDFLELDDNDIRKITRKNPLLMSDSDFHAFLQDLEQRAVELQEQRQAKLELIHLINQRGLQKVDNYRKALELPSIDKMTTEQLRQFATLLEPFHEGDVFLTQRELETVERTDLGDIKTWREAREKLAEEVGVTVDDLQGITPGWADHFRWDTSLAAKNPFYQWLVHQVVKGTTTADLVYHDIETKAYDLARKSEKSRSRGLVERMIPEDKQIMTYLEEPADMKEILAEDMTQEQLDYAFFIQQYFGGALEYLMSVKALDKGRENYFVHMRKTFLESVRDDGLIKGIRDLFKNYEQDQQVFNILDDDTGNILPLEKFFQFALHRTGYLDPTSNVTRAFLTYVKTLEKKKTLDGLIPKIHIYTQALTPTKYTPRGLEYDASLKKFVNKYVNNKKGRHISFDSVIRQGGPVDMGLTAARTFTTLMDLGLNIPVGIASFFGEQAATFTMIGNKGMALGTERMLTKQGRAILDKYEVYVGRSLWEEFTAPGKQINERLAQGLFGLFHKSSVVANSQFLLGSLSKEEFRSGELAPERLAELKLEMGRFRAIPGSNSLVGSTSAGKGGVQYKSWAVPILRTLTKDFSTFTKGLIKRKSGTLTGQEAKEIYRFVGLTTAVLIVGALAHADDPDDKTFLGQLRARIYRETMTLLQAIDPKTFLSTPRTIQWITDIGKALHSLVLLEEYKTKEGYKGLEGLKRSTLPSMLRKKKGED